MRVKIQRNQLHHFKEPMLDSEGKATGEIKDVLQLDVRFPEYPDLPTYGLRIDFPINKQKVLDAIKVKAQEAKAQISADDAIRAQLGEDVLDFNVEV